MSLKFDLSDFDRVARELGVFADQIPFVLSFAMNKAAIQVTKNLIDETWPKYVEVRNRAALRQGLRVERSKKRYLTVAIAGTGPAAQRLNLAAHAHGGSREHRGRRIAIPLKGSVRRGAKGVVKGQRPHDIIVNTPKRALRVTKTGIFVGEGGKLQPRYFFTQNARIPADVPFDAEFERMMLREMHHQMPAAVERAMRTAFKR